MIQLPLDLPDDAPACSVRCGDCLKRIREEALWAGYVVDRIPHEPEPRKPDPAPKPMLWEVDGQPITREESARANWERTRLRWGWSFRQR